LKEGSRNTYAGYKRLNCSPCDLDIRYDWADLNEDERCDEQDNRKDGEDGGANRHESERALEIRVRGWSFGRSNIILVANAFHIIGSTIAGEERGAF
jgi:hypothetical protein